MSYRIFLSYVLFLSITTLFSNEVEDSPPSKSYLTFEEDILGHQKDIDSLSEDEIEQLLNRGKSLLKETSIIHSLMNGGSALFPHAPISKCGDQIAAVVEAALEAAERSNKNKITVLGVIHSLSEKISEWKYKEIAGENVINSPCRGVFGPDLPNSGILKREYSLNNFLCLMKHALKLRGNPPIEIIVRFPFHVSGQPETLSGIEELQQLTKESIVVATADTRHFFANCGKEITFPINEQTLEMIREEVQIGLDILKTEDLLGFRQYCYKTMSDASEVGQILRTILGPLEGHIHDFRLVEAFLDRSMEHPELNWVVTSLIELKRYNPSR